MAIKRDKILKTAEKLVQKGKLEPAIREFEKLLQLTPDDTTTVNRLGDLYGRVGQVDKAVALYEKVAEKFADQGFLPKAIAIYKKINRLVPQRLDIFERLGELYAEQGLKVEAKSQFQMLAEHYVKNEDIEGAIRVSQRLSDIDPGDPGARLRFADLLLEQGDSDQAMEAYGTLGESLLGRGQLEEAERLYRRLLDREIPDGEIMAPICDQLIDANRVAEAQEFLSAGLEVSPQSSSLQTLQVRASMAMGDKDDAVALARRILEKEPENSEVRSLVGTVLMSEGDPDEATEMMIPAAEALLESADYSRAQQMLRELVRIAPRDERILRLAVRAFRPSGDQEMITSLTASLAEICFESGQTDQARRFFMELVASDPTNELYRKRLAQLDGATPDEVPTAGEGPGLEHPEPPAIDFPADDVRVEDAHVDDVPPAPVSAVFDPSERIAEAAVFAKYGLNDKAASHLESVIERVPDHIEAREALARLYLSIGQRQDAVETIEPVVADHRGAGREDEAAQLASEFGLDEAIPDEDEEEIIIVEIDGDDEPGDGAAAETLQEIDDLLTGDVVSTAAPETESEPEPEVVEEELVELSTGVDGPSFNELAQLDLFIEQELLDDAMNILDRLENQYPGDPDLVQRRTSLVDRLAAARGAREVAEPEPHAPEPAPEPESVTPPEPPSQPGPRVQVTETRADEARSDEYIDLAKELEAELAEEEAMVEEATGRGKGEAMLDEVFKEFQKGVAEQLSDEDSDTHFNLGIAYKEMGLLEQAIGEFQVASHDPAFFVEACSMIGVCANELGNHGEAAEWYQKALVAPDLSPDARAALRYELALAFQKTDELEQAVELFEQIAAEDPGYRDVAARLAGLSEQQRQVN